MVMTESAAPTKGLTARTYRQKKEVCLERQSIIERAIVTQAKESNFSGVVSIRQSGAVLFARAFGYANRAEQTPNTIDTRF